MKILFAARNVVNGTSRHAALPRNFGRKRGTADMAMVAHVNRYGAFGTKQTDIPACLFCVAIGDIADTDDAPKMT